MIKVPKCKTYKEQYNNCMNMRNRCFPLIITLNFVYAFIYLIISHGGLPLFVFGIVNFIEKFTENS